MLGDRVVKGRRVCGLRPVAWALHCYRRSLMLESRSIDMTVGDVIERINARMV